jgi:hypothetical protein
LERIELKFAALCFNSFFLCAHYRHVYVSEQIKLHAFRKSGHHLDALFLLQVYFDYTFSPSLLETIGLRVPARCIRKFSSWFNLSSSSKNCSPANIVCKDAGIFGNKSVSIKYVL